MLQIILVIAVVVGIVTFLMQMAGRWAGGQIGRDLEARLRAGESLVNQDLIPEVWLVSYRKRITQMREAGKGQEEIDRVGAAAHAHCLHKMDDLILFFQKTNLADSPDTLETILASLREQRTYWARQPWQVLFAPPPNATADGAMPADLSS